MRYSFYFKISLELLADTEAATDLIKKRVADMYFKQLKISRRIMAPLTIRMNLDGDDFTRELTTVLITSVTYKIPRIVKKLLAKRLPKNYCDNPLLA